MGVSLTVYIKLARYKSHPLVVAGEVLKEPLLHLVATKPATTSSQAKKRQQRSKRSQQQRKRSSSSSGKSAPPQESPGLLAGIALECPECDSDVITHDGPRLKRCNICFHEWVVNMVRLTVSGHPGSGTSTLVRGLMKRFGWNCLNGGGRFPRRSQTTGYVAWRFW